MKRFLSTLKWEIIRQYKNGIYFVSIFVLVIWVILFSQIKTLSITSIIPMVILGNLNLTTFYFMAGLLLLEKGEGSLAAQVTTPLRSWEYLSAKVLSLSALAVVENVIITIALVGWKFNYLSVILGTLLAGSIFCLVGFLTVIRYDSINEFLIPSLFFMLITGLPILAGFLFPDSFIWYGHPVYGTYKLIQSGFSAQMFWQILYALLYPAVTLIFLGKKSLQGFNHYVVRSEGAKPS
jgi:fluoroquinolone transport system permease protein